MARAALVGIGSVVRVLPCDGDLGTVTGYAGEYLIVEMGPNYSLRLLVSEVESI